MKGPRRTGFPACAGCDGVCSISHCPENALWCRSSLPTADGKIIYLNPRLGRRFKPLEVGVTRYISTRGTGTKTLRGDADRQCQRRRPSRAAKLAAALARGDRRIFGRPYWEVAVDVIKPFVGGEISDADLGAHGQRRLRHVRHPPWFRSARSGRTNSCSNLFHGPTLAFKDVAMQLISRLMDHVLEQRPQSSPSWSRPRRYRRCCGRRVRHLRMST